MSIVLLDSHEERAHSYLGQVDRWTSERRTSVNESFPTHRELLAAADCVVRGYSCGYDGACTVMAVRGEVLLCSGDRSFVNAQDYLDRIFGDAEEVLLQTRNDPEEIFRGRSWTFHDREEGPVHWFRFEAGFFRPYSFGRPLTPASSTPLQTAFLKYRSTPRSRID